MKNDDEIDGIVERYENNLPLYKEFEETLSGYLKEIIEDLSKQEDPVEMGENDIEIKTRTKEPKSLRGKIKRKNYDDPLAQVTDLVGAKIMLTSLRYADLVYELVKNKFSGLVIEKLDKSDELKKQRKFGYLGRHIVIRCKKGEGEERFRKFDGLAAEIQIKTLLQHTWAEIEHKLRYKPQTTLDQEKQRYFDRLAAMMEVADDLFKELILEWERISNRKSQKISEEINMEDSGENPEDNVSLLDSEAILFYLENEKVKQKFSRLRNGVENLLILEETPELISAEFIGLLELAKINGTKKLNELLDDEKSTGILQEYTKHLGEQIRFHQIVIMQILVYAQLDKKTREMAKNKNLVYRNVSEIIDAVWKSKE